MIPLFPLELQSKNLIKTFRDAKLEEINEMEVEVEKDQENSNDNTDDSHFEMIEGNKSSVPLLHTLKV